MQKLAIKKTTTQGRRDLAVVGVIFHGVFSLVRSLSIAFP